MTEKDFINIWFENIKKGFREFPYSFISSVDTEELEMPGKNLLLTPPLFDYYEIVDIDGNIIFHTNNYFKAKYILYANRSKPLKITIPRNSQDIEAIVKSYENYIDEILRAIERDYKKSFSQSRNFANVSNQIFNLLNLIRI